jgi:hypothetical protein
MRTLNHYLFFLVISLVVAMFVVQGPFLYSNNNYPPYKGFTQPCSTEFTRWIHNPLQNQNNGELCPALGLIPAPVDLSMVAFKNPSGARQSKITVPGIGNRHFEII